MVDLVRRVRDAGFDSISCGQHYFTPPDIRWETVPLLARLLAEAGDMRLGTSVLLLPLHNPVLVAEQMATLDIMSNGRLFLGLGSGFLEREFRGFGVPRSERSSRLEEGTELIRRLWTEDELTFHGQHYQVEGLSTGTKPLQKPTPPIWIAGLGDAGVRRVARIGDSWLINPYVDLAALERQTAIYRDALATVGKPFPPELPIRRDCYLADNREQALRGAEFLGKYYTEHIVTSVHYQQDLAPDARPDLGRALDEVARDRFLVGTPDECVETIQRFGEALGCNHFILAWPELPHEEVLQQVDLLGRRVIPRFK
jgi:alkanesulfonate monooxygenase SsuD/methylene tetrahydromethanopterin reductase-like flavin-dependent oxidoreductase (luciferase family)